MNVGPQAKPRDCTVPFHSHGTSAPVVSPPSQSRFSQPSSYSDCREEKAETHGTSGSGIGQDRGSADTRAVPAHYCWGGA